MLKLKNISKIYTIGDFTQKALDDVSISFRKNEFASILGPSGSGKTTLLNIIGGLDHYDDGDLVIDGVSTKEYKDRDWDTYRNHKIGFVFQSYNLISHQTILKNVELALTLSGISKKERLERAKDALEKVGLLEHAKKRPNQLSGGQMQRVAIARALVNNPDILLADEPTGALDTNTSVEIMKLLEEIAQDKLVIMVTHNPDLAKEYSTRIVMLKDGKIVDDTNPYEGDSLTKRINKHKHKEKKTSMNFFTALALSLNNLLTKKGRTILTAFAGSIGIIGIALILSLSNGVNTYIDDIQKETMLSYPITIEKESVDISKIFEVASTDNTSKTSHKNDAVYSNSSGLEMASSMSTSISKNNLTEFKKYLDSEKNEISKYTGENGIVYSYDSKFNVYNYDKDGKLINADGSSFEKEDIVNAAGPMQMGASIPEQDIFTEIMSTKNEKISSVIKDEYEIVYGDFPNAYNEVVLVLDKNNEISTSALYNLGLLPSKEYKEILEKMENQKNLKFDTKKINYEDITNASFKLLTESDFYIKKNNGLYDYVKESTGKVEELVNRKSLKLKVVGIIKPKKDTKADLISGQVGYTKDLTDWIVKHTDESSIVKDQEKNKDINVLNGLKFKVANENDKINETKKYIKTLSTSEKATLTTSIMKDAFAGDEAMTNRMLSMSEEELASVLDSYLLNPDSKVLTSIYDNFISSGSYDENLSNFGKVSKDTPSKIDIYTDSFENKDKIKDEIEKYNKTAKKEDKINYTDYVGLLMSSITTIINTISYVLIAFVSISLVVSSIMIAIITYISVLERTKEIGILRAIGASKKDITRVFKAETFIEGAVAGLFGVGITILLNFPINKIISKLTEANVKSHLPLVGALILVLISILLTVISGRIPSRLAAKKDPVEALRTE